LRSDRIDLTRPSRAVVRFYNKRGTAEAATPTIKEGKQAVSMTRRGGKMTSSAWRDAIQPRGIQRSAPVAERDRL
jgi:hypothetical protein